MSEHDHNHAPRAQDNPNFGAPVSAERTAALQRELDELSGVLDTGAVRYWLTNAINATSRIERNHFLRRKAGAEQQARLEANSEYMQGLHAKMDAAKARFDAMPAPVATLENRWPRGGIVRWDVRDGWDDFHVACRDKGKGDDAWRSVTTKNLTQLDREMVLPLKYLNWGDSEPPYELCVLAVMNGVGTKRSNIVLYDDPQRAAAPPAPLPEPDPDTLSGAQRAAVAACDAEIEYFEETGNDGALEWCTRARNSVLGISPDPFTRTEAESIAAGAGRPEGRSMWTLVAAALP